MAELVHSSIGSFLHRQAERFADREALVSADTRIRYRELIPITGEYARRFLSAGITKGSHVGLIVNDQVETLLCYNALWRIGAIVIPICTGFSKEEILHCVQSAEVEFLIIHHEFRGNLFPELVAGLPVREVLTLQPEPEYSYRCLYDLPLADEDKLTDLEQAVLPEDPDSILFTSGSTGSSKPVLTSHFARVNTFIAQAEGMNSDENDRYCSVLPLFHCFSMTGTAMTAIAAGACLVFPPSRKSEDILQTIEKERCTILTAVPTLFSALIRKQEEIGADISSLRTGMIGGSSYKPDFFRKICEELGFTLLPSLGQTEATAGFTCGSTQDSLELRSTSLGKAFPHIELCIKDTSGVIVPPGMVGEICFRGFNEMIEYYHMPEATAEVRDKDNWIHTGDLGRMDNDDTLYYCGRLKDIIIRGGENITPDEIEAVLTEDQRIAEVKVIGVPDPHYIEEVCACITPADGAKLSEDEVREHVREKLSAYKVPRYVLFFDTLPHNSTGKILRKQLKDIALKRLGL